MIDIIENKCDYCGACASVCPVNCIDITESINRTTETNYIYENMKAAGFEIIKKSPIGNKNSKSFNVIFKRE